MYGKQCGNEGSAAGGANRGAAAQEELVRRTPANVEDLATFLSAYERTEAVDGWLAERLAAVRQKAVQRRSVELAQVRGGRCARCGSGGRA